MKRLLIVCAGISAAAVGFAFGVFFAHDLERALERLIDEDA